MGCGASSSFSSPGRYSDTSDDEGCDDDSIDIGVAKQEEEAEEGGATSQRSYRGRRSRGSPAVAVAHASAAAAAFVADAAAPAEESSTGYGAQTCKHYGAHVAVGRESGIEAFVASGTDATTVTRYQWRLKNGAWVDFEDEEQQHLVAAWMCGSDHVRYSARGFVYEVYFFLMIQQNLTTNQKRMIRVKPKQVDLGCQAATAVHAAPAARGAAMDPKDGTGTRAGVNGASAAAAAAASASAGAGGARTQPGAGRGRSAGRFSFGHGIGRHTSGHAQERASDQHVNSGSTPESNAEDAVPPAPQQQQQLPAGVELPEDAVAREAAIALFQELLASQAAQLDVRRSAYRSACLLWHPDKNLDREDVATEVFQFLQALRDWYFCAN